MNRFRFDVKFDVNKISHPVIPIITKYSVEDLIFVELCRIDPFFEVKEVWKKAKDFFGL